MEVLDYAAIAAKPDPGGFPQAKGVGPLYRYFACMYVYSCCLCGQTAPGSGQSTGVKRGGTIVEGLSAEPASMDPLTSASLYDADVMANMYDSLLMYDTNSKIQPDLASSYTFASPTVLNLTLRNDVKFQDGTPFNADAVVF